MNEITLSYLFKLALKRIWAIIIVAVIFFTGTFCYYKLGVTPRYRAKGSMLVTNGGITVQDNYSGSTVNGTDISASLLLSYTVTDILSSPDVYKELSTKLNNKYSPSTLQSMSNIERRNEDTLFIDVSFTATEKEDAVEILNTFLSIAPSYINKYIPHSNANIATGADSASKVYPNEARYAFFAAIIGAVITFVVAFIIDSMDNTIKGEEFFTENYDIPLLGSIPNFNNYKSADYVKGAEYNAKS